MSEQWSITTLGEIATIKSGSGFPVKFQGNQREQFPFYKVGDMNNEGNEVRMEISNHTISEEIRRKLKAKIFPAGSIIFPKVGGAIRTNKKRIVVKDCCVDNNVMGLIPNENKVLPSYLYYFMTSVDLYEFSNKAALPSIRQSTVKDWKIPVPSLNLQQTIVNILDEFFSRLSKSENQLLKETNLIENILNSTISSELGKEHPSWSESILDDVCLNITDGSHNPPKGCEFSEYRMLSSRNVFDDSINFEKFRFITEEQYEKEHKRTKVEAGDILLTIVGTIGRCAVVDEDSLPFTLQRSVAILKPNKQIISSRFLMYSLIKLSSSLNEKSRGAAQKGIYLKQLRKFTIQYPDLKTQLSIIENIDQISKLARKVVKNYRIKYDSLSELRQSVLYEAFSGKLTGEIAV